MKRETRFFTLLALGSTMAFAGIAQAQAPASGSSASTGAPAPGTVTNQTSTTESTTTVPATDMMTETTTIEEAPLENTGGEPLMFAIGGALLAGGALVMRRRLSNEVR